jgi:general secretion pathway protein H
MQPTSPATSAGRAGFLLLEMLVALTVLVLIAAIVLPRVAASTGAGRLQASAMEVAALLESDRTAAMRTGAIVATGIDLGGRTIVSGSGASRPVTLPEDVDLKVAYAAAEGTPRVRFFPNGSSSGADIVLTAASAAIDVRVDWFTGAVAIAGPHAP